MDINIIGGFLEFIIFVHVFSNIRESCRKKNYIQKPNIIKKKVIFQRPHKIYDIFFVDNIYYFFSTDFLGFHFIFSSNKKI
eukprot:UN04643